MATLTGDRGVFTCQIESGQIVVKGSRSPTGGGVTGTTISAKATLMDVIRHMARNAILRSGLEIGKGAGIDMALPTQNLGMFSVQ
jgi:hypothetical protein